MAYRSTLDPTATWLGYTYSTILGGCPSCQSFITNYPYPSLLLPGPAGHTMSSVPSTPRIPTLPPFSTLLWKLKTEDQEDPASLFSRPQSCDSSEAIVAVLRKQLPMSMRVDCHHPQCHPLSLRYGPHLLWPSPIPPVNWTRVHWQGLVTLDTVRPSSQMDLRRS